MHQRTFITSTGTGIGKTFITAALARQAKALGKSVAAFKPVISGFDPLKPGESDAGVLLRALDLPLTPDNIQHVSPWRFAAPLAPTMAARLEKRELKFNEILAHGQLAMQGPQDTVLIEGVGGVMAPLADQHTIVDLIQELGIEAVLVTGSYLGTISHTLTALSVLVMRRIPVFAVIVNETPESTVSLAATVEEFSRWTRLPIVAVTRQKEKNAEIKELRALLT
jgi:dethiobiotin synthetase